MKGRQTKLKNKQQNQSLSEGKTDQYTGIPVPLLMVASINYIVYFRFFFEAKTAFAWSFQMIHLCV